jgi:hypothetical protein
MYRVITDNLTFKIFIHETTKKNWKSGHPNENLKNHFFGTLSGFNRCSVSYQMFCSTPGWTPVKSTIFSDMTCSLLKVNGCFGGTYRLHLQGFLLGLFFDPEDEGDMFLRNVGWLSTDYTALYLHNHRCENPKSYTLYYLCFSLTSQTFLALVEQKLHLALPVSWTLSIIWYSRK